MNDEISEWMSSGSAIALGTIDERLPRLLRGDKDVAQCDKRRDVQWRRHDCVSTGIAKKKTVEHSCQSCWVLHMCVCVCHVCVCVMCVCV